MHFPALGLRVVDDFPALGLRVVDDFPAFEGAADTLGKADGESLIDGAADGTFEGLVDGDTDTLGKADGESLIDGAAQGAAEYSGQTPALMLSQPSGMAPPLLLSK